MRTLAALAIIGLLYLSLFPFQFNWELTRSGLRWGPANTPGDVVDVIANFIAYLPIGFLGVSLLPTNRWRTVLLIGFCGTLMSWGIEWAQLYLPTRNSSYRDLACNSAGTFVGAWIASVWPRLPRNLALDLPTRGGAILLGAWIVWHNFPFLPNLRRTQLAALSEQLHQWNWDPIAFMDCALGSLLLCLLLWEGSSRQGSALWRYLSPALVAAPVALQFVLPDILFSTVRTSAVLLGLSIAAVLKKPGSSLQWRTLAVLLGAWLAVRQLEPFQFSRMGGGFHWWPLGGLYSLEVDFFLRLIAGKLFLYTAVLAAFVMSGASLLRVALLATLFMGGTEFLQRFMPGRSPEITDVLLIPAGALLLRAVEFGPRGSAPEPKS